MPAPPLVTVSTLPVTVERTVSTGDMQAMTIGTTGAESIHKYATVGTTLATRVSQLGYGASMITDPATGRVCFRPVFQVTTGYEPLRITVAEPFHSGSCAYNTIVEHEMHHVKIYDSFLASAAESIEQAVTTRISDKVRYAPDVATAHAEMRRLLRSEVFEALREQMTRVDDWHARFDSTEESLRLLNSCNGELRSGLDSEVLAWKRQGE